MTHDQPAQDACLNCGSPLYGRFCSLCGQKIASVNLGLHDFLHDAIHEFLHVDGKLFRTMALLLFKPGTLTRDFAEGRRVRHISPIRLYLLWSVIFFAIVAFFGHMSMAKVSLRPGVAASAPNDGSIESSLIHRLAQGVEKVKKHPELLSESLLHSLPKAMFLLMPVAALLVLLFYRKTQRFYIPHLYFSIHMHAFAFCLLSTCVLVGSSGITALKILALLATLAIIPYFLVALRTVYGGSWPWTLAKGLAMVVLYFFLLNAGVLVVILVTVLTV